MMLSRISGSALVALVILAAPARAGAVTPLATPTPIRAAQAAAASSRHGCVATAALAENTSFATLSSPRRALAIGAAAVPGVVVHGAGHVAAGDTRTGLRLLAIGGGGAGLAASSVAGLAITGASRHFAIPLVLGTVTGAGFFLLTALADLYGVIMPEGAAGCPARILPSLEVQIGLRYVHDPTFSYRAFLTQGFDLRLRSVRLGASGAFALDDVNARVRGIFGYRLFGPRPSGDAEAPDGSFLDLEAAVTRHRYPGFGFAITTGEISLGSRFDLARLSRSLQGSFVEMAWGMALEAHSYDGQEFDASELLLGRFGFGIYLGREGYPRGEATVYYDHRHDDYAGGLKMQGLGSGAAGHFGTQGKLYFSPRWGLAADAQVGSALLAGVSLLFKHGGHP
jgi:hypothetical protein